MTAISSPGPRVTIERWPSEQVLFAFALVVSLALWLFLIVSIVGAVYAVLLGAFFFVAHVILVFAVRGNGVRLGPDQFPELHARVEQLARTYGMERVPEAYLMQAGGALNAFATKFLGSNMIVLFSDLLEACGDNTGARDMIIGHELGHVAAGHLRFQWLVLPASLVPFLGTALSRAREYTCDRYGAAGAGDHQAAVLGLTVLAAGGKLASRVNRTAFAQQRGQLNTGWMTIGEWLSTHPPLCKRISAIDQALGAVAPASATGGLRALGIVGAVVAVLVGGAVVAGRVLGPAFRQAAERQAAAQGRPRADVADSVRTAAALKDLQRLAQVVEASAAEIGKLPDSQEELYQFWGIRFGGKDPVDPFGGKLYGYVRQGDGYLLWSVGPDGEAGTDDDIVLRSGARTGAR